MVGAVRTLPADNYSSRTRPPGVASGEQHRVTNAPELRRAAAAQLGEQQRLHRTAAVRRWTSSTETAVATRRGASPFWRRLDNGSDRTQRIATHSTVTWTKDELDAVGLLEAPHGYSIDRLENFRT